MPFLQSIAYYVVSFYRGIGMVCLHIDWKLLAIFHKIQRNIIVNHDPQGAKMSAWEKPVARLKRKKPLSYKETAFF